MTGRNSSARQSSAVMANRAPQTVEDFDPRRALYRTLDFYPTPPWAARAGGELIKALDPQASSCLEPACGQGHMAEPLREYFTEVRASDIHPFGYGEVLDFLMDDDVGLRADWIVTNPPFRAAGDFLQVALPRARRGVAMLCRLAFLESEGRYDLLYGAQPLAVLAPFSERVPMQLGSWNPSLATATAYAWFIWRTDKRSDGGPPTIRPIGPGTRRRLSRPGDPERFAPRDGGSLFGGGVP